MPNNLTELIPLMNIKVLDYARANAVAYSLAYSDYGVEVAQKGDTVKLNVMNDFTASTITPGNFPPAANNDIDPDRTNLTLNQWEGASFELTSKDLKEIVETGQMKALESAVAALADKIDASILGLGRSVYNFAGTAGTTPFGSNTQVLATANRMLSTAKAPKIDRALLVDEFAYSNATQLNIFQQADQSGTVETLTDAIIPRRIGYSWGEDQNVLTHAATGNTGDAVDTAAVAGATSITIDDAAGSLPTAPTVGDVFTIAGNTQQYVVTSYTAGTTDGVAGISPALVADVADGDVLTFVGSHVMNLAFQRDAFHVAIRPTDQVLMTPAEQVYYRQNIIDPISGISMTMCIFEKYHQTMLEVSALWGVACPRPDYAVRILG